MDRGFALAADLIRHIDAPMVGHFFRADVRGVDQDGLACGEILFGSQPELKGRDILVVDAVFDSGVTQDFFLRRLGEGQPRSARLAALLDKRGRRRVDLEQDYFGFRAASNQVGVGYGLAVPTRRNPKALASGTNLARNSGKGRKKKA
jgi:hypoxanthine phosphoribosyltransferase